MDENDRILIGLISMAESETPHVEAPITINSHGVLMAGHIISRRAYLAAVATGFKEAVLVGSGGMQVSAETAKAWRDTAAEVLGKIAAMGPGTKPETCLHLSNVRILSATKSAPISGGTWRVRLADVSAWMLGTADDE